MILSRFLGLERRSMENPKVSLNDDEAIREIFGDHRTDTGLSISHADALAYSPVWQAISLLSGDVAKLPLCVYERLANGGRTLATSHPAYSILRWKPNGEQHAFKFFRTIMAHALLWNNAYAYIYRDGAGRPLELVPLLPDRTGWGRKNSQLWFVTEVAGELRYLLGENVFHLSGLGTDGVAGCDLVEKAKNSFALGLAAQKFASKFFSNGAKSSGVLHYPGKLTDKAKANLLGDFEKKQTGLENAHKVILLEENAKFVPTSIPPNEGQMGETRKEQRIEVASWFNLPPHKLGDSARVSYNSLEQENQSYLDTSLDHWLVPMASEARDKLLTEDEKRKDSHFVEHNVMGLLRVDASTKATIQGKYRAIGVLSVNEIRQQQNLPPIGPEGDVYGMPARSAPSEAERQRRRPGSRSRPNSRRASNRILEAHRAILARDVARMVRLVGSKARKESKKPQTWVRWLDSLHESHRDIFAEAITPAAKLCWTMAGRKAGNIMGMVTRALDKLKDELLEAADGEPDGFEQRVDAAMTMQESELPEAFANKIIRRKVAFVPS